MLEQHGKSDTATVSLDGYEGATAVIYQTGDRDSVDVTQLTSTYSLAYVCGFRDDRVQYSGMMAITVPM